MMKGRIVKTIVAGLLLAGGALAADSVQAACDIPRVPFCATTKTKPFHGWACGSDVNGDGLALSVNLEGGSWLCTEAQGIDSRGRLTPGCYQEDRTADGTSAWQDVGCHNAVKFGVRGQYGTF